MMTVDEDRDQTRAIHAAQRRAQTLEGLTARTERDQVVAVHRDAQRLLEPLAVVNPFADRLTFADGRTRTRRDHGKYLGLISAVTLLHQHQRPRKTSTINGKVVSYVETTIADIEVAHRLAHAVLGQSLDELAPQTRRLLTAVDGYVTVEAARLAIPRDLVRFTRRQLREHVMRREHARPPVVLTRNVPPRSRRCRSGTHLLHSWSAVSSVTQSRVLSWALPGR